MFFHLLLNILLLIITYFCLSFFIKIAQKRNIMSFQSPRSLHKGEIPRGGGIIFGFLFLIFSIPYAFYLNFEISFILCLYICSSSALILGFLDDIYDIDYKKKLIMQFMICFAVVYFLNWPFFISNIFFMAFLIILYVWFLNSINFMDGIDGFLSSTSIIICSILIFLIFHNGMPTYLQYLLLLFLSSISVFLFYNWSPAKLFMGDSGSLFIGIVFCIIFNKSINDNLVNFTTWIILFSYVLTETSLTLLLRLLLKKKWFRTHRSHAYQNLARVTKSHKKTTIIISFFHFFWILPLVILNIYLPNFSIFFIMLSILPVYVFVIKYGPRFSSE